MSTFETTEIKRWQRIVIAWHVVVFAALLPVAILRQHYDAGYVIQFSQTPDFSSIVTETTVKPISHHPVAIPPQSALKRLEPGVYYWRVAEYDNSTGGRKQFSQPFQVTIQ
jgi:hypothetical protein